MMTTTDNDTDGVMYLPKDTWSPRYDSAFFTVTIDRFIRIENRTDLPEPIPDNIGGRDNLPAYYFQIIVYREHTKTTRLRRYSHFKWMYDHMKRQPPQVEQPITGIQIRFPTSWTCPCQRQDDEFARNRLELLQEFLDDLLRRPGYANHPTMRSFLEI